MKISIITATYNSSETLPSTFQSILSQSYSDFEYWILLRNMSRSLKDGCVISVSRIKEFTMR